MAIEIRQEEQGDVRILALSGRLDTETSADLELALADLQAAGANRFVIDMADIGYVSSAGLRVLLALAKQLEGSRGSVRLCSLNDAVKQVFDVAGFSRMFAIFPDRDTALGAQSAAKPKDSGLARRAAGLLGAADPGAGSGSDSAGLARTAAQLLDADKSAGSTPKTAAEAPKAKPASKPAAPPRSKSKPAVDQPGMLGKLRSLLGNKK
jgi:stage II sporulation protein AA (anti-sigma F factor antagonist)